jgi:hypothetical protein
MHFLCYDHRKLRLSAPSISQGGRPEGGAYAAHMIAPFPTGLPTDPECAVAGLLRRVGNWAPAAAIRRRRIPEDRHLGVRPAGAVLDERRRQETLDSLIAAASTAALARGDGPARRSPRRGGRPAAAVPLKAAPVVGRPGSRLLPACPC